MVYKRNNRKVPEVKINIFFLSLSSESYLIIATVTLFHLTLQTSIFLARNVDQVTSITHLVDFSLGMNGSVIEIGSDKEEATRLSNDLFIQTSDDSQCIGWSNSQVSKKCFFMVIIVLLSVNILWQGLY